MTLSEWTKKLGREPLDLWREAMANLRQLHNDVWNGVRFFMTVNGILLAGVVGILKLSYGSLPTCILVLAFSILGLTVTVVARCILRQHRDYYLQMLLRKTLIEDELGFYNRQLGLVDLSFPWTVAKKDLEKLKLNPDKWLREERIPSKWRITKLLFRVYDFTIALWCLIALISIYFGLAVVGMSVLRSFITPVYK